MISRHRRAPPLPSHLFRSAGTFAFRLLVLGPACRGSTCRAPQAARAHQAWAWASDELGHHCGYHRTTASLYTSFKICFRGRASKARPLLLRLRSPLVARVLHDPSARSVGGWNRSVCVTCGLFVDRVCGFANIRTCRQPAVPESDHPRADIVASAADAASSRSLYLLATLSGHICICSCINTALCMFPRATRLREVNKLHSYGPLGCGGDRQKPDDRVLYAIPYTVR